MSREQTVHPARTTWDDPTASSSAPAATRSGAASECQETVDAPDDHARASSNVNEAIDRRIGALESKLVAASRWLASLPRSSQLGHSGARRRRRSLEFALAG